MGAEWLMTTCLCEAAIWAGQCVDVYPSGARKGFFRIVKEIVETPSYVGGELKSTY